MTPMDIERLRDLVAAYGAEPVRWPEPERDAALALMAASAEAREVARDAGMLDRALDLAGEARPSADLAARVVASARPREAWPGVSAWRPAAILAAAAVLGLVVGSTVTPVLDDMTTSDAWIASEAESLLFGPGDAQTEDGGTG